MKIFKWVLALVIVAIVVFGGYVLWMRRSVMPSRAAWLLRNADTIQVLALNPEYTVADPNGFHWYPVLGRADVPQADRKAFVEEVIAGAAPFGPEVASCFNPRQGIHASSKRGTVDLAICFECGAVYVFYSGDKDARLVKSFATRESLTLPLSRTLARARIPFVLATPRAPTR